MENGLYEWYYENGQLEFKDTYKDGERNGLSENYYENGQEKEWSPCAIKTTKK